jgi:sec-independent protein translocase protein TatB
MGLFEILLIAVVTLLVVGPERMPETVRSVALTIGRFKRMLSSAREEIEKQVGADDIRQQLHNEAVMDAIAKSEDTVDLDENIDGKKGKQAMEQNIQQEESQDTTPKSTNTIDPSEHNSILDRSS